MTNKKRKYLLSGISLGVVTIATTVGLIFGFSNTPTSTLSSEYKTINNTQEFYEQAEVSDEQYFTLQDQESGKYLSDVNSNDLGYAYWSNEEIIYGYGAKNSNEDGYLNIHSFNPENEGNVLTITDNNNIYWTEYNEKDSENQNLIFLYNEEIDQYSIQFENGSYLNLSDINTMTTGNVATASNESTPSWFKLEKVEPIWFDIVKLDYLGDWKVEMSFVVDNSYTGPMNFAIIPHKFDESVGGKPYAQIIPDVQVDTVETVVIDYSQFGVNEDGGFYTVQLVYGSIYNRADITSVTMDPIDLTITGVEYPASGDVVVNYTAMAPVAQNDSDKTNNVGTTNNKLYWRSYETANIPALNDSWVEFTPTDLVGGASTLTVSAASFSGDFVIEMASNDVFYDDPNAPDLLPDKGYVMTTAYENQVVTSTPTGPWLKIKINAVYGFIDVTNGAPTFTYIYSKDPMTNKETHEMTINYNVAFMDSQNWVEVRISGDGGTTWSTFVDGSAVAGPNTIKLTILPKLTVPKYQVQIRVTHNLLPEGPAWVEVVDKDSDYDGDGNPDPVILESESVSYPVYMKVL